MKPLLVLLTVFGLSFGVTRLLTGNFNLSLSGSIAMSAMLLLTASGHFMFAKGMQAMLPPFLPFKKAIVFFTGIFELAVAVGLLIPSSQKPAAWGLIIFFVMILPANISAAVRGIDYQKGTAGGPGINYLWFRVPLQLFFIAWVYFFSLYLHK